MNTPGKRYYTPTVTVDAEVSLDEFSDREIVEYLTHRGYTVTKTPGTDLPAGITSDTPGVPTLLDPQDLNHIATLAIAGQVPQAQAEALALIGNAIGRPLQ